MWDGTCQNALNNVKLSFIEFGEENESSNFSFSVFFQSTIICKQRTPICNINICYTITKILGIKMASPRLQMRQKIGQLYEYINKYISKFHIT